MCKYISIFVFSSVFLGLVKAQDLDGTPCETPGKQPGSCISVYSCKVVTEILSNPVLTQDKRNYVRSLGCGYKNGKPLVCCPSSTTRENPEVVPVKEGGADSEEINNDSGVFLSPPACGVSNVTLPKIVGGVAAKLGDFPWIVALGYKNAKNPNQPRWLCGGSLVSSKHVLTAAHCVYNRDDLYLARLGELDLYDDQDGASPVDIPIASTKIHENYNPSQFTSDIAMLTLSRSAENLPGVHPICLPWQSDQRSKSYINSTPFVAGWGALYFNGPTSTNLQLVTVPVVDNSNCARVFASRAVIDERIVCAGYPNGQKDACSGDSGGPLMLGIGYTRGGATGGIIRLQFQLIGIVSYGFRCAQAGYPGVYTKVTYFLPWIQKNLI